MGFFDRFGGGKSKAQKLTKKIENAYIQPADRQRFMHMLAEIGTEEALTGLMRRFTYRTEQTIVDHEEKKLARDLLVHAGPTAVKPIEAFVMTHDAVYWPLQALRDLTGMDRAVELLLAALDRAQESEARVNDHKVQLVSNLRDFDHPDVRERLISLCSDDDEEVRVMACDGIVTYGEEVAKPVIAERLMAEGESPRVKAVVIEQMVDLKWSFSEWEEAMTEAGALPAQYRFGGSGKLVRNL